jgi:hypothetical protein
VGERDVRTPAPRETPEALGSPRYREPLRRPASRALPSDYDDVWPSKSRELDRLRVVACTELDLVTFLAQAPDNRPQEGNMRRVGQVDPNSRIYSPLLATRLRAIQKTGAL